MLKKAYELGVLKAFEDESMEKAAQFGAVGRGLLGAGKALGGGLQQLWRGGAAGGRAAASVPGGGGALSQMRHGLGGVGGGLRGAWSGLSPAQRLAVTGAGAGAAGLGAGLGGGAMMGGGGEQPPPMQLPPQLLARLGLR